MALDFAVIGQRIKNARLDKNLTQEKLAERLDLSVAFLSRLERGSMPINLKRLSEICIALGVSEDEILTGASTLSSNYLDSDFSDLLKDCPPDKMKLIYDISKLILNKD